MPSGIDISAQGMKFMIDAEAKGIEKTLRLVRSITDSTSAGVIKNANLMKEAFEGLLGVIDQLVDKLGGSGSPLSPEGFDELKRGIEGVKKVLEETVIETRQGVSTLRNELETLGTTLTRNTDKASKLGAEFTKIAKLKGQLQTAAAVVGVTATTGALLERGIEQERFARMTSGFKLDEEEMAKAIKDIADVTTASNVEIRNYLKDIHNYSSMGIEDAKKYVIALDQIAKTSPDINANALSQSMLALKRNTEITTDQLVNFMSVAQEATRERIGTGDINQQLQMVSGLTPTLNRLRAVAGAEQDIGKMNTAALAGFRGAEALGLPPELIQGLFEIPTHLEKMPQAIMNLSSAQQLAGPEMNRQITQGNLAPAIEALAKLQQQIKGTTMEEVGTEWINKMLNNLISPEALSRITPEIAKKYREIQDQLFEAYATGDKQRKSRFEDFMGSFDGKTQKAMASIQNSFDRIAHSLVEIFAAAAPALQVVADLLESFVNWKPKIPFTDTEIPGVSGSGIAAFSIALASLTAALVTTAWLIKGAFGTVKSVWTGLGKAADWVGRRDQWFAERAAAKAAKGAGSETLEALRKATAAAEPVPIPKPIPGAVKGAPVGGAFGAGTEADEAARRAGQAARRAAEDAEFAKLRVIPREVAPGISKTGVGAADIKGLSGVADDFADAGRVISDAADDFARAAATATGGIPKATTAAGTVAEDVVAATGKAGVVAGENATKAFQGVASSADEAAYAVEAGVSGLGKAGTGLLKVAGKVLFVAGLIGSTIEGVLQYQASRAEGKSVAKSVGEGAGLALGGAGGAWVGGSVGLAAISPAIVPLLAAGPVGWAALAALGVISVGGGAIAGAFAGGTLGKEAGGAAMGGLETLSNLGAPPAKGTLGEMFGGGPDPFVASMKNLPKQPETSEIPPALADNLGVLADNSEPAVLGKAIGAAIVEEMSNSSFFEKLAAAARGEDPDALIRNMMSGVSGGSSSTAPPSPAQTAAIRKSTVPARKKTSVAEDFAAADKLTPKANDIGAIARKIQEKGKPKFLEPGTPSTKDSEQVSREGIFLDKPRWAPDLAAAPPEERDERAQLSPHEIQELARGRAGGSIDELQDTMAELQYKKAGKAGKEPTRVPPHPSALPHAPAPAAAAANVTVNQEAVVKSVNELRESLVGEMRNQRVRSGGSRFLNDQVRFNNI